MPLIIKTSQNECYKLKVFIFQREGPKKAAEMFLVIAIGLVTLHSQAMVATCNLILFPSVLDQHCRDGVCAILNFYDESDVLLHTTQGSNPRMRVKGVAKVQTVGGHGCYTIFKRRDFRSTNICWNHNDPLVVREAGYPYAIVRYVSWIQNI